MVKSEMKEVLTVYERMIEKSKKGNTLNAVDVI